MSLEWLDMEWSRTIVKHFGIGCIEGEPDGSIHNWRHPHLATSRYGGIQRWRHPWLVHEDRKLPYMFSQVSLVHSNKIALKLSIEYNSRADPSNMCLIIIFRQSLSNGPPPKPFRSSSLSKWLRRKFPQLFSNYDMLSDMPSPTSPLDVAPTNLPIRGSRKAISIMAPQANGSAPLYTSETSFNRSN